MSGDRERALQELLDHRAIEQVVVRYAWATDTWDPELTLSCFTDDAVFDAEDGRVFATGTDELRAFFNRGRSGGRLGTMADTELVSVSHPMANVEVRIDGDVAEVRSACTSYTFARGAEGERVFAHGLRYTDVMRRAEGGWRISRRTHHLDWQFEVPANPLPGRA